MIPINQQQSSLSSLHSQQTVPTATPKNSICQIMEFSVDAVIAMFPCLRQGPCLNQQDDNQVMCCQYLSGTLHQIFTDEINQSDSDSGASSPLMDPSLSSASSGKCSSVKRRKNCKLNHKVDGNLNKAENESEESMHFFATTDPCSSDGKEPSYGQKKKSAQSSGYQQFDGILATLSEHLVALQEEIEQVENAFKVASDKQTTQENDQPSHSPTSINQDTHLNSSETILFLLHQIFRDLNKVKRILTFKTANRRKGSQDDVSGKGGTDPNSPSISVSSRSLYNSNIERLIANRMFVLQLLHLECSLLRYLKILERRLELEAGAILSMDEYTTLQLRLEDLLRSYYILLTKLSYEPSFLKIVRLIHRSTPTNGASLLLIIFRSLVLQKGAGSVQPSNELELFTDDNEEQEKIILAVEHGEQEIEHEITVMDGPGQSKVSDNVSGMFNNRTVVLMLTFLQGLAKEDIFASAFSPEKPPTNADIAKELAETQGNKANTTPGEVPSRLNCSLVAVCQELLTYFCPGVLSLANFPLKSLVRQHAIETMAHLCLTRNGLYDAISYGSALLRTLLSLLSQCASMHLRLVCSKSFQEKSYTSKVSNANKPSFVEQKLYLSTLRDIYGLLSILISMTEFKSGRECLLFHNVATSLFEMFMQPFVETLNGSESDDPQNLIGNCSLRSLRITDRAEAYMQLRAFFNSNQKMQRYLDRIIGISSIIIQRLLDPLPILLEHAQNPFTFNVPVLPKPCHFERKLADTENEGTSTPGPTDDDKKHFEAFDSDLDEDDEDEDESEDDEDSFIQNPDSSTDNATAGEELVDFSKLASSKTIKGEDIESILLPYLQFFPEIQHFNWNNINDASGYFDEILACSCDVDVERFLTSHNFNPIPSGAFLLPEKAQVKSFDWRQCYENEFRNTSSVMPCHSLPLPELNFLNAKVDRNELPQPMTYPFLDRAIRRKNYHHIKLLDHVKERLECRSRPVYQEIYDIEKNTANHNLTNCLQFDSKFECGNLRKVFIRQCNFPNSSHDEYLLLLNTDINSSIHTQWFYFSVRGMKPNKRYRFKIINLQKKSILYNSGQQPVYYSNREFEESRKMWQRIGVNEDLGNIVAYYRNHYVRGNSVTNLFSDKPFYTLEFTFTFPFKDDTCYFSYNVPFSYTFLRTNLVYWHHAVQQHNQELSDSSEGIFFRSQTLASSLKGNDLPVMTITSNSQLTRRHYILISARVHPSESNSSWIMKGFIDFLLHPSMDPANEQLRRKLLKSYVFKVIPMLNPDGVINGSTRTDLQRDDLNRQWQNPHPLLHPTIFHSRMLLRCLHYFSAGRNPVAFIDLHGHSRRKNIFSYSCSPLLSWKKSDRACQRKKSVSNHFCLCPPKTSSACQLRAQMKQLKDSAKKLGVTPSAGQENRFYLMPPFVTLPVLLQLQRAPCFNLENCSFSVQKDREHTARVVGWREFDIPLTYTVECTASGCDVGPYAGYHLAISQMEEMGKYLASSFGYLDFLNCSYRHVPVIVMPRSATNCPQQSTSPIRHPGNDDFLKNLLDKCTKRYRRPNGEQSRFQIRKLIQLYPDLNMLSASIASSSSNSSLSSIESLSLSQPASPGHGVQPNTGNSLASP